MYYGAECRQKQATEKVEIVTVVLIAIFAKGQGCPLEVHLPRLAALDGLTPYLSLGEHSGADAAVRVSL